YQELSPVLSPLCREEKRQTQGSSIYAPGTLRISSEAHAGLWPRSFLACPERLRAQRGRSRTGLQNGSNRDPSTSRRGRSAQDFACWLPLTCHAGSLTPAERLNLKSAAFKRGVGVRVPLSAPSSRYFPAQPGISIPVSERGAADVAVPR